MSQKERTFSRPINYYLWRREPSISRFLDSSSARKLYAYQVMVEFDASFKPCAIMLLGTDCGQNIYSAKEGGHMEAGRVLAKRLNVPLYLALYKISSNINPAYKNKPYAVHDIDGVRALRLLPSSKSGECHFTPHQWANFLDMHRKGKTSGQKEMSAGGTTL